MNFDHAADELRREEFSRLAVTPRPEALRAMTADALRDEIAAMCERLGHTVINGVAAPEIVTKIHHHVRQSVSSRPDAQRRSMAVPRPGCCRQRRARILCPRARFTAEAQQFAEHRPCSLIDGGRGEKAPCCVMLPTRNVKLRGSSIAQV
jgi:hypothetical protein